ncbi:MAG: fumarylacetoacetate hydrolase family protein [Bacteroidia bacterium]
MHNSLAERVDDAARLGQAIPQLSKEADFSVADAYDIQTASMERRYARGERFVGLKLGFTSKAKRVQMGVDDLIWGRLTDAMQAPDGGEFSTTNSIHPRIEPEVAFILKKAITRPISLPEAPQYIEAMAPALEIIDSRYQNFQFSLADVVADNCSSSGFILGPYNKPDTDIHNLGMLLHINGKLTHTGSSAAILGNPMRALHEMARLALAYGQELPEGSIILAGAATPAVHIHAGDFVQLEMERLGNVSVSIGD